MPRKHPAEENLPGTADMQIHEGNRKAMIDTIRTSLKLAVVVVFALACVAQQTPQSSFSDNAVGQAENNPAPDVVTHSFDSAPVADNTPAAAPVKPTIAPKVEKAPVPVAMQAAASAPEMAPPTVSESETTQAVAFQQRHPRYLLRAGDVFDVNFEYSPELNQTVSVQPDGFVTLREAGDIYVQGLSLEQLNAAVRKGYENILHAPSIAIVPKNFEQPYFVVGGEVKTPGKFDLRGPMTVAEAVALAGGFTESAKHSHVLLFHRESPDKAVVVRTLNIKRMLNREDLKEDAQLHPGDMIYVPQNTMSKVKGYVIPKASVGPNIRPNL